MAVSRQQIQSELCKLLEPHRFRDYCPNGLQVEGRQEISRIVSGVTASQALIEAAIASGADMLLVHHGYFWKGEAQEITGMKRKRLQKLLTSDLNLFAYHLPLDAHPDFGNNAQLGRLLGFSQETVVGRPGDTPLVAVGTLKEPLTHQAMLEFLEERLQRQPMGIEGEAKLINRVAWCTGAAQNYIDLAVELGVDAFITGEVSEQTFHVVRETGIHFFAAGHHATERYGVQAVGNYLADKFALNHQFIDIDNPV